MMNKLIQHSNFLQQDKARKGISIVDSGTGSLSDVKECILIVKINRWYNDYIVLHIHLIRAHNKNKLKKPV